MEASADLSIITLIAHASAVVQIVLAILLIFSLVSWTIIFQKWFQMSRARREARNFDKRFWGGADLNNHNGRAPLPTRVHQQFEH